ncbi:MAG: ATP-binding cassette domain-containing protein, partial [Bdellovibrionales bacterium]|nr:ATP-binding cassette domain-containing protein [Bdellovibrionales bacterium]
QIAGPCDALIRLGLGHLTLGHPLSELSGGEAQRLKLVPFIGKSKVGRSLLIFDEPSTGLHLHDVRRLIAVFLDLKSKGHTILCIEHNQEIILASDWIIDLGPEGGSAGGELVLAGKPQDFLLKKHAKKSFTAQHLQDYKSLSKKKLSSSRQKNGRGSTEPTLSIKGAREHNLKNIDIAIPHDKIVALTGVSGSGKSTIAKDIVYAEGQRRYLDCLSPYARQFIRNLSKPNIDEIHQVRPTICIHQHTFKPGKLSTIGTMSEVYNFLRLLFAKVGQQYCPTHPQSRVDALSSTEIAGKIAEFGSRQVRLLAPIIKGKKGHHKAVFTRARSHEIAEVRVDGIVAAVHKFEEGLERHKVHNIDFVWGKFEPERVPSHLLKDAVEEVFAMSGGTVVVLVGKDEFVFSRARACPECGQGFFKPDPEDLSFHSKRGQCVKCSGSGVTKANKTCPTCHGSGLNEVGRNIRLGEHNIFELASLRSSEAHSYLQKYQWTPAQEIVAAPILRECNKRLETLAALKLDYLPLSRPCDTLSTGELQRLRLAAAMGTPLSGSMYIFDEPTSGLHPCDNHRVLAQLQNVQSAGNSVVLIEHDESSIAASDHVIELGPGGGAEGGLVTFHGKTKDYLAVCKTRTIEWPEKLIGGTTSEQLMIKDGHFRNIEKLNLSIPLQRMVTIAGVSGAGKSSLVNGIIRNTVEPLKKAVNTDWKSELATIQSTIPIDRVMIVDQSPVGKNSRSTPASYLGVWDHVRTLFAQSVEAKARGWKSGFFSYNSGDGRCPECKGLGEIKLEMNFLADARVTCEFCDGLRFGEQALSVTYLGKTIADVLRMTFEQAKSTFSAHPKLRKILHNACELGLGYLTMGQSSTTLSGGECQRIKLVSELSSKSTSHTLYILDEPTRGLHQKDVALLLHVLRQLCAQGHSILLIEHDHDVLRHSDHVIELGPDAGEHGGQVIYQGTPEDLKKAKTPWGSIMKKS